jgi:hypothetical protein
MHERQPACQLQAVIVAFRFRKAFKLGTKLVIWTPSKSALVHRMDGRTELTDTGLELASWDGFAILAENKARSGFADSVFSAQTHGPSSLEPKNLLQRHVVPSSPISLC